MALYVEQFLDSLNGLPTELKANLTKMRTVDGQVQSMLCQLDKDMRVYVRGGKNVTRNERLKRYSTIEKLVSEAQAKSEEKVALAHDTYELVDKQIRKLDDYLERFQADLRRKYIGQVQVAQDKKGRKGSSAADKGTPKPGQSDASGKASGRKRARNDSEANTKTDKKKRRKVDESPTASPSGDTIPDITGQEILKQLAGGDDVMNMPIDPNEPTYCLCQRVSYGDMIACDNPECRIEWFHVSCVGLSTIPKGKWYCTKCDEERKKKKKMKDD